MGWFDEQIKQRKSRDEEEFSEAMAQLSDTITRKKTASEADENAKIRGAIDVILRYYHCKPKEIPERITDLDKQLEFACRPYGIMRREVILESGWYKDAVGAMLGRKKDGTVVALLPNKTYGYSIVEDGKKTRLNRKTVKLLEQEAFCFYKPFPMKKIGIPALVKYIIQCVPVSSLVAVAVMMGITTLIGMISPKVTHLIFSDVIESGSIRLLLAAAVLSVCVGISSLMVGAVQSLVTNRINTQMNISVQAAVMARIMSLPAGFFKDYSSGELAERSQYINSLCNTLISAFMVTGLSTVFSLAYISQVFVYAPTLVIPALCITLLTVGYSVFSTLTQMRENKAEMLIASKCNGMTYSLITGIQKIKLAGAEKRAFTRWAKHFNEEIQHSYGRPTYMIISGTIGLAISLLGAFVMYFLAIESGVSVADYYAFTAAYGMVSGAFMALADMALNAAQIRPVLDMAKPILDAVPEISEDKQMVERLSGGVELNNVSFRYNDSMPNVIDDLTLKIRPGQYVAIVGRTGCGKSTLVRLLLGFEKPQKGAIYYDGRDMQSLDPKSLRHNIGTVIQNGKLLQGSLFENISISAPELTLDEAWEAAELAGIADDIREMPMGMQTMISEGSGGISGGQKQRLMIARSIASKPKILILDEATSALDNITQKKIADSLDTLKCTRIVIAHRLSTIRHCDRIIVLDGGRIVEDGTYEQLIRQGGFFAELVERQRVDV
ncbi:MAG: NHLP bacteriocin export ABC transporter permease/ATPase subunit [Oscillospiraceae bacterium]